MITATAAAGVRIARVPEGASQHQEAQRDDEHARCELATTDGRRDREPPGQGRRERGQRDDDRRVGKRGDGPQVDRAPPATTPPHVVVGLDHFAVARYTVYAKTLARWQ